VHSTPDPRITVVVITHNRRDELLHTLDQLARLPERPPIIVVDNASQDGTGEAVHSRYPDVRLIEAPTNLGAVGRNTGTRLARTPYVAFCDDDTWWEPGALARAADLLDAHPRLAVVTATIMVEPGGRDDPINQELRNSPVEAPDWLPGPALGSFLAGASVLRRDAFESCGGFHPRLWLGGEEELLSADLATAGWELCYAEDLVAHHWPSVNRDCHRRRRDGIRNTLWFIWLRRPLGSATRRTWHVLRSLPRDRISAAGTLAALRGAGWVIRERRIVPPSVERRFLALERSQATSTARRYVS